MRLSDPHNVSELRSRAVVIAVFFASLVGILILRLWYLQIWQGEMYREFSDQNRFKVERLSAPRGQIVDRNGTLLADSRPRFDVLYTRGYAQDLDVEVALIADILKWKPEDAKLKLERLKKSPRYQGVVIEQDISHDELTLLQMNALDLPGLDLEIIAVRDFLYKDAFFHVLGYTGEIGERDLKRLQERYPERNYKRGDQRGIIGIESLNEGILRGVDGRNFSVVDVKGRRINSDQWEMLPEASRVEPVAGRTLRVSLDLELQLATVKAFGDHVGAAVAIDPRSGEILAYVSRPAIDPNWFTKVLSSKEFEAVVNQEDNPFLDRNSGEHYPPGSPLKLIMAAAALENGVIDEKTTFYCGGSYRMGRRSWGCHKKDGHGRVNVVQAIEQSCDVFFYNAGLAAGLDSIFSWATRFGLGRRTFLGSEILEGPQERLFRFNSEQTGFVPYEDWIRSRRDSTVEAETLNAAIGQGAFETTLLQLVRMVSAIGNGGKIFQPQLVLSSESADKSGHIDYKALQENHMHLSPASRALLLKGMDEVVNGTLGTARASKLPNIHMGGKTGTSQVVALEVWKKKAKTTRHYEDHGLFVALAPMEDPQIAIAVIVEHGGQGSRSAAPIAKQMVQNYIGRMQTTEVTDGTQKN